MIDPRFADLAVLLVDDDNYQRRVQERMLNTLGVVNIYSATSAHMALELVAQHREQIALILCDLDMPDMDGMELLRRLAQLNITASILVISGKHESILRSVTLMAKGYGLEILGAKAKPASLPMLREALQDHVQRPVDSLRATAAPITAQEIELGMERSEFEPFFQPKVDLKTQQVRGFEALARWRHPQRGIVPPVAFIDVAENNGLISSLTWIILEKSAQQMHAWLAAGLNLTVSINFSQVSLGEPDLAQRVLDTLERVGVPPERFIIEITESMAMKEVSHALENLSRLRMKGLGLSIDDFGTGHSSMQQLSMAPYTELKVDQMFVTGATNRPHLSAVAQSSVDIARKLQLHSVGEGLESLADWAYLQALGCEMGQGDFISLPIEGPQTIAWVQAWNARPPHATASAKPAD